tara:strand:+ start:1221 stop:2591 length:1371 start_codon:yes stop_codon:yes gene_type:complete
MSDIRKRRNSLLKSSISINSIRTAVSKFTKGLVNSRETASQIVSRTRENNIFKQGIISKDNSFFKKRQENVRRKQREDELEASGITGAIKRQGTVIAQSTKGFLGRILDFFGIILIGWFVNSLPNIIKALGKLIDRIKKVIGFLSGFMEGVGDFLTSFGMGISEALQKLPKIDLLGIGNKNKEDLELANNNLVRVSNDLLDVGSVYNKGGRAINLEREDGDYTIISDDDEKKEEKPETPVETTTPNPNDGKLKEEKQFTSPTVSSSLDSKKSDDGSGDDLIKGIQNDPGYSDIKSAEARKKGETIDNKNLENENKKDQDEKGENIISNLKIRAEKFFGNIGQQQTNDLKAETLDKKDNSSMVSGAIATIKNVGEQLKDIDKDKKITPTRRERTISGRTKSKRNQVIIMEKAIVTDNSSTSISGGGSGGGGLNNLGEFSFDNEKKITKKLQSVILNT